MSETIQARVARGAALLDEKLPGWWQRIDLERLDLGSECNCILGQEFADDSDPCESGYATGRARLLSDDSGLSAAHGFTLAYGVMPADSLAALEVEWRRIILARRGGEDR